MLVLVGLLLAGVPFSLVEPRGWGDLVSGLSQGIETLPSMRIPYRGAEPWAHDTLVFIGYLLVALATVLACLPRGDARPGRPLAAAVVVGVLVGVPSVSLESGSPVLIGLVFTALLVAYLRIDRVRRDAMVWAGATVAGVLLVALVLAPRVDADRPLIDYEAIAALGVQDRRRELQLVAQLRPAELAAHRPRAAAHQDRPRGVLEGDEPRRVRRRALDDGRRPLAAERRLLRGARRARLLAPAHPRHGPRPAHDAGHRRGDDAVGGQLAAARPRVRPRALRDGRRPAHLRPGLHGRGVRAGADPPCPGARVDDLSALQPGVPQHGAADAGRRPAVDRRDRELPGLELLAADPLLAVGLRARGPRWTCRRSAATRATAPRPWRPRGTRARGI